jgi:hypothetical protein
VGGFIVEDANAALVLNKLIFQRGDGLTSVIIDQAKLGSEFRDLRRQ